MTNPHDLPAFPTSARGHNPDTGRAVVDSKPGMSIWDAAALASLAALTAEAADSPEQLASDACAFADAFVAMRDKRRKK